MKDRRFQRACLTSHPMTAVAEGRPGCITGNMIAPACIDPVGQAILESLP